MSDDKLMDVLVGIEHGVTSDQYEISDPFTIGGPSGTYTMESPYNTESEWAIVSALGVGTLASTATYAIGSKNPNQPTLAGTSSFGSTATTGRDTNNALPSFVGAVTAQAPFVTYGGDNYMPLGQPTNIYLQTTTPASSAVLVTIIFRRKLDRVIPEKPRQKPHTHSHVGSRGPARRLAAQSTQVAGYESQYPELGAEVPYAHGDARTVLRQGATNQDTGVMRRGAFPLGPTNVKHRGR